MVSVYRHDTKTIAAQRQVPSDSNEITVFGKTLDVLPDLTGHLIVADALHTQRAHATYLHGRHACYLFPVALNQPNLFAAVNALPGRPPRSATSRTTAATVARHANRGRRRLGAQSTGDLPPELTLYLPRPSRSTSTRHDNTPIRSRVWRRPREPEE